MSARPARKRPRVRLLLAALLLTGLAVYGVLALPVVRARMRAELVALVRRDFGLEADVSDVSFALPFALSAQHVSLRHPEHGLLAEVKELSVAPSLRRAVLGELKLKRVVVEGARVRLRIIDGEIVNGPTLKDAPAESKGADPLTILRELRIYDGRFEVDAGPEFSAGLVGVEIAAHVRDDKRLGVRMSIASGSYQRGEVHEQLSPSFFNGRYSAERLDVDSARITTSLGHVSVKRARLELPADHGRYQGQLELAVKLARLRGLPFGDSLPELDGEISAAVKVSGSGKRYAVQGKVHGDNPELAGVGFGVLDLLVEASPDEVRLLPGSVGHIVMNGGEIGIEGRVGLGAGIPVEARFDVRRLEFHKLMAQLGVTDNCVVNWVLKGGARVSGTVQPLDIKGPIWADHVSFKALTSAWHDPKAEEVIGTPPGRVHGRVALRPDALRFENLVGKLPHSEVHVTVHVGFDDKIGVTAASPMLDLRDATGLMGMPIGGHGPFTLDVGGTYASTTLTGSADFSEFMLDGYRLGQLKTRAILEQGGVAVRFVDSTVRKNDSRYVIDDMLLDFSEHFSLDASARFERLELQDFYHSVLLENDPDFTPFQGRVHGEAKLRYTLGFPGDDPDGTLQVDAALDVDRFTAYGLRLDGGHAEASYVWRHIARGTRGVELALHEARLTRGGGTVLLSGGMALDGRLNMTAFGEQLHLRELLPAELASADLDGELGFAGHVGGTVWLPEAHLDAALLDTRFGQRALGDGELSLVVSHQRAPALAAGRVGGARCALGLEALRQADWGVPGDAAGGEGRGVAVCSSGFGDKLAVDAVIGVGPELPVRGRIDLRALPLAWLVPGPESSLSARLAGELSGQLTVTAGALRRPDALRGRLVIDSLRFGDQETWLASRGPMSFALRGDGLEVEQAELVGRGTHLTLFGAGSLRTGLRAGLQGKLDLSVLPSLTGSVSEARGSLELGVKVSGSLSSPSVFGRAEVRDGALTLARFAHPITGLQAAFNFTEHEILLESARAELASGVLSASGAAAVDERGLGRYRIDLRAENLALEPTPGVEVAFSADTTLASRAQGLPELTGTVRLQRAVYKRPISLGITERLAGFSQARRAERESYDPALDHVSLDLQVVNDGPLRVQNNLLSAELRIEDGERPFRIVGTDQRTGALGTLELTRGTLQFRSTQFLLDSGTVTFVDELRLRTRLDLSGRTEFRRQADASGARWLISLRARGDSDNLKIETSSSPALAQEDIALLLTVGLTRAEAERLGTSQLTQGAALEALASVTGVDREVKKALPVIDDFTVTSAYSARTNRTEPQVVVGKRLSDRVRASATTGLTADSNFKAGVQWRLNDQTAVEAGYDNVQTTTSSQFGNVGVDLRWRLEFD